MGLERIAYQQRVIDAAERIAVESGMTRGFDFTHTRERNLVVKPYTVEEGSKVYGREFVVTGDEILGEDPLVLHDLEEMIRKMQENRP